MPLQMINCRPLTQLTLFFHIPFFQTGLDIVRFTVELPTSMIIQTENIAEKKVLRAILQTSCLFRYLIQNVFLTTECRLLKFYPPLILIGILTFQRISHAQKLLCFQVKNRWNICINLGWEESELGAFAPFVHEHSLLSTVHILMSHHSKSTWLFMSINLQLQTSDFVDVDSACDHCYGFSKSQKNPFTVQSYIFPPWGGSGLLEP